MTAKHSPPAQPCGNPKGPHVSPLAAARTNVPDARIGTPWQLPEPPVASAGDDGMGDAA